MTRRASQWAVGFLLVFASAFGGVAAASSAMAASLPAYGPVAPSPTPPTVVTQSVVSSPAAPGSLAFTGTDVVVAIAVAAVAIAIGGMLVLAARRRRQPVPTA